eukprot:NODE_54_length_30443_cov_1.442954.p13 type:complete len:327 gc:universal NODE_54_length_30443_cov_1.442954:22538-21558(-)
MFWRPLIHSSIWQLGKPRLSALVVFTTLSGYAINRDDKQDNGSVLQALTTVAGTSLCAFSANTLNQLFEYPMDAQMVRTRTRVLTSGRCLPLTALAVGLGSGILGISLLSTVNTKTAILGASTIGLYALVYTPLKRFHHASLWVGSLVGAIPPLMGYCARYDSIDITSLILPTILAIWQFPHFNPLAHFTKASYAIAGYPILSITQPFKNSLLTIKYSQRYILFCCLMPLLDSDLTSTFITTSSLVNLPMLWCSYKFHQSIEASLKLNSSINPKVLKFLGNAENSVLASRRLFFVSLINLPLVIGLFLYHRSKSSNINHRYNINKN